jgi:uncharacterized membrane protein YhiD involved in acid resistance
MKTHLARLLPLILWIALLVLCFSEPLLANKFETIGGGVQGQSKMKIDFLRVFAFVASGIFLIAGILSIALHDKNAHSLNYTMWKTSAAIFFLLSIGALIGALLV